MPNTPPSHFDVCIVCALPEEAEAFEQMVTQTCQVEFQEARNREGYSYKWVEMQNRQQQPVNLHLSMPLEMGPEAMAIHLTKLLDDVKPQFVAMCGICAGDRKKVKLGDLVVAERSFTYSRGKVGIDEDGREVFEPDVDIYHPDPATRSSVNSFRRWQQEVTKLPRPASKKQQQDWLLSCLAEVADHRIDSIPLVDRSKYAPAWRKIMAEWQQQKPQKQPLLSPTRQLIDVEWVNDLANGIEEFPFVDPEAPEVHIKVMASSDAVRADSPFALVRKPVRSAVAIDMESAVFYRVVAQSGHGTRSLVVKGVCDYADPEKDDSYHAYAARASALYLLVFIQEYITGHKPKVPAHPEPPPPTAPADACKLYFCCAPEDTNHRREIEKHLVTYVRLGRLTHWQSYDPALGQERAEERTAYIKQARLILLLLSPDLMKWEAFVDELQQAYAEYASGRAVLVVSVLLRDVQGWKDIPFGPQKLGDFQPIPHNGKFIISNGVNRDKAFADTAGEIIRALFPEQR